MGQKNLPLAGSADHVKAFKRLGWRKNHETSGRNPHIVLVKEGHPLHICIPNHKEDVKRDLLATQLQNAGITEAEYLEAFYKNRKRAKR